MPAPGLETGNEVVGKQLERPALVELRASTKHHAREHEMQQGCAADAKRVGARSPRRTEL